MQTQVDDWNDDLTDYDADRIDLEGDITTAGTNLATGKTTKTNTTNAYGVKTSGFPYPSLGGGFTPLDPMVDNTGVFTGLYPLLFILQHQHFQLLLQLQLVLEMRMRYRLLIGMLQQVKKQVYL